MAAEKLDSTKYRVVFVLGGPGAGKGSVCSRLQEEKSYAHYSAGDLLRAAVAEGSEQGELINSYMKQGKIVPPEMLMGVLRQCILGAKDTDTFLIDGFPRSRAQAEQFEALVVKPTAVLVLECTEDVMLQRCLQRGESSGRVDDNSESLKKRFAVFVETTKPVIEDYEARGDDVHVLHVDGTQDRDTAYQSTLDKLASVLSK
jgi:UMP-CMP kinase